MRIVGCDFHSGWQQLAVMDTGTGELIEWKLVNGDGETERFYRGLEAPGIGRNRSLRQQSVVFGFSGAAGARGTGWGVRPRSVHRMCAGRRRASGMRRTF